MCYVHYFKKCTVEHLRTIFTYFYFCWNMEFVFQIWNFGGVADLGSNESILPDFSVVFVFASFVNTTTVADDLTLVMFRRYYNLHIPRRSPPNLFFFTIFSLCHLSTFTRAFSATTRRLSTNGASSHTNIIGSGNSDMLIRIRNNVGTWKIQLENDNNENQSWRVKDILSDGMFEQYKLVQQLSLDPSGTKPLLKTKTLMEQGLSHGSMIYCRVTERDLLADDDDDESDSSVMEVYSPPREIKRTSSSVASINPSESFKPAIAASNEETIEILSSDDDDDDLDKSKQKPSPRKRVARKRSSSPVERTSTTSTKKAKSSSSTQSSQLESPSSSIDFKIASYNIW